MVPNLTKPFMIAKIRAAGATDVIQHGATWADADAYLRAEILGRDPDGIYVPPFDDPLVWEGSSTIVDEMTRQMDEGPPDAIVCSVGGGGLFCGIMRGLERRGESWEKVRVLAMETVGAESLAKSLAAGERVTLDGISSIAISLGAVTVAEQAFRYAQRENVKSIVLRDAEAVMGVWRLADDERILVEPACGVSVATCYDGRLKRELGQKLGPESKVVIVVCGGSHVTVGMIEEWRRTYGDVGEMAATGDKVVPSTNTRPQPNGA